MAKEKNKFVIECHEDDLNFLLNNYEDISASCIKEFELPSDSVVKLRPVEDGKKGCLQTFLNGEYFGDILIKDKRTKKKPEPKKQAPDRGLH